MMRTERTQEKEGLRTKGLVFEDDFRRKKRRRSLTDCGGNVGGGVVRFLEAVLEVSGDPHGGEWALSRQKGLRIEHGSVLGILGVGLGFGESEEGIWGFG